MVTIVTSATDEPDRVREQLIELGKQLGETTTLIWSINHTVSDVSFGTELHTLQGEGIITEEIRGSKYRISPNAFFQTNPHAAAHLLDTVDQFTGDRSDKTLLDLYCGTGFFAIALANGTHKTIGSEMVEEAIIDARKNAELNGVDVEFEAAKTEDYDWGRFNADIVILDPPRSGMHDKALADVMRIAPERIVYVSCNPKNFAREMVQLQEIYHVQQMRAIDMFPHTPHVELVSLLVKKP